MEWPFIRPVFVSTFALLLVLAMGDVAIFSILGNQQWQTLPWLIYGFAGSYRLAEASLASLILLLLCAIVVLIVESQPAYSKKTGVPSVFRTALVKREYVKDA
jgi:thiamine transport system permease protein